MQNKYTPCSNPCDTCEEKINKEITLEQAINKLIEVCSGDGIWCDEEIYNKIKLVGELCVKQRLW